MLHQLTGTGITLPTAKFIIFRHFIVESILERVVFGSDPINIMDESALSIHSPETWQQSRGWLINRCGVLPELRQLSSALCQDCVGVLENKALIAHSL